MSIKNIWIWNQTCLTKFLLCWLAVCWTKWYDRDNPSGTGDWEPLSDLRNENPGEICANPIAIESKTVDTGTPAATTGQDFLQ